MLQKETKKKKKKTEMPPLKQEGLGLVGTKTA